MMKQEMESEGAEKIIENSDKVDSEETLVEMETPEVKLEEEVEEEKGAAHEHKVKLVKELAEKVKNSKTVLIASTKNLPSSQFQLIKKKLRGKVDITVVKKSMILRAIEKIEKGALQNLKEKIGADVAIFFSELDAFELSALLSENLSPTKAKSGDVAPEDIKVEPGPTDLTPGPAISELSGVGLKVAVEDGKLAIKKGATIVKKGEVINEKVASVMGKLGITPIKVGFEPIAAYDSKDDKVYVGIKINKEEALEELRTSLGKAFGLAVNIEYLTGETVGYFVAKAGAEEKVIEKLIEDSKGKEEDKNGEDEEGIDKVTNGGEERVEGKKEEMKKDGGDKEKKEKENSDKESKEKEKNKEKLENEVKDEDQKSTKEEA